VENNFTLGPCSPFFIVSSIQKSLTFYVSGLGFQCRFISTDEPATFAIVGRDSAQIMLKMISESTKPLPNSTHHSWAKWDAFIYTKNPLRYEEDLNNRGSLQEQSTHVTSEGLNGFELKDPDGYVCFFGHPI